MTISYAGSFWRVLVRWKGSIWKACWVEIVVFLTLYYAISLVYRFWLNTQQRQSFENVVILFHSYTKDIPITFLLGFYVSAVVKRWWKQVEHVAFPDDLLSYVCFLIPGEDETAVQKRRTMARLVVLSTALCWRDISKPVRKRFPTIAHLVKTGLMTDEEFCLYESTNVDAIRWALPLHWCQKIIENESKAKGTPAPLTASFLKELYTFRDSMRQLYCFDWVCVPLVYTQVATLVTYGFFTMCVIGRQFLRPRYPVKEFEADFYIPVFSILQLLFYIGWFKVAQYLMRPFGEDDDDLELNYLLDRHLQVALEIVDDVYRHEIQFSKDAFYGKSPDEYLPHTALSLRQKQKEHPPKCHVNLKLKRQEDAEFIHPCLCGTTNETNDRKIRQF